MRTGRRGVTTPEAERRDAPRPPLFDLVGGMPFFERLIDHFYEGVAADPVLLRLYDAEDLAGARRRLMLFLVQYWGGPAIYSEERGHPRLRARHFAFPIGSEERDHWRARRDEAIRQAADEFGLDEAQRDQLDTYFELAAEAMRNRE